MLFYTYKYIVVLILINFFFGTAEKIMSQNNNYNNGLQWKRVVWENKFKYVEVP